MKTLYDYITEFKVDLMPQCVVVMGGPGAGKTYWMNNSSKQFFQSFVCFGKRIAETIQILQIMI